MMKNRFLFVAMLFAALSLGFVSCDNKGNEPEDPQGEQTEQNGSTENNGGEETPEPESPTSGTENGHEWVDLGLSVKWATCNVGATKPEEYGNYYAWGEVEPKEEYNWDTYKWATVTWDSYWEEWNLETLTKYCTDSYYGTVDNKTVLDPEDDAAAVNMGGSWRMPTYDELEELIDECTWTWTTLNDVNGYNVEGPNGNAIFLPAAGYRRLGSDLYYAGSGGRYWSSSLRTDDSYYAYGLYFCDVDWNDYDRYGGLSVRGVFSK